MDGIHLRLREGKDDDIADWYKSQIDRSEAVRIAIRTYMRLQVDGTQESVIKEAVAQGLAQLPDVVATAVQSALSQYRLAPATPAAPGEEDPELAARLNEQIDSFF